MKDIFYLFQKNWRLVHSHIPHIPFDESRHAGHSLLIVILSTHPVQVEQEAYHEVTFQHLAPYIFKIVVAIVAGNALVLVQDIIDSKFQFPVLLFE